MLKLPKHIQEKMHEYRAGLAPLPEEFNTFMGHVAMQDCVHKMMSGVWELDPEVKVLSVTDGWCDGAKFLQVGVIHNGEKKLVRWHESGAWFTKKAGWVREFEMDESMHEYIAFFHGDCG